VGTAGVRVVVYTGSLKYPQLLLTKVKGCTLSG
jgi:hypothetical protein